MFYPTVVKKRAGSLAPLFSTGALEKSLLDPCEALPWTRIAKCNDESKGVAKLHSWKGRVVFVLW